MKPGILMFAAMFFSYFMVVGGRAFQNRNVAYSTYILMIPVSVFITTFDVFVVATIAEHGYSIWNVLAMGTGGGVGTIVATVIHKRLHRGKGHS